MANKAEISGRIKFEPRRNVVQKDDKPDFIIVSALLEHTDEKSERRSQFRIKAFNKLGDKLALLTEGQELIVIGRLEENRWLKDKDKPTEEWKSETVIVAYKISLLESLEGGSELEPDTAGLVAEVTAPQQLVAVASSDDDVPF